MNFLSDNTAGIAPGIIEALAANNQGHSTPYGEDDITEDCQKVLSRLFDHKVAFIPVGTGTAANALGLAVVTPPEGAIFCHERAHINLSEAGAPEFFTGGAKLIPIPGPAGKITVAALLKAYAPYAREDVHRVAPKVISITQPTEWGACYSPDEIRQISRFAKNNGLLLHMDGARFANAVSYLKCHPKEISWKAGVDILSLGLSKNGAMGAEAVIFFDPEIKGNLLYRQKRSGHMASKARFISAQLIAMFKDNYWLELSSHANALAQRLASELTKFKELELVCPVEANLLLVKFPNLKAVKTLNNLNVKMSVRSNEERPVVRLVCSFMTTHLEIDEFVQTLKKALPNS